LAWAHYSPASLRDAKIDTSQIKLANRDLAVLTPDESDWFRALQFLPSSERGAARKLAGGAPKIFEIVRGDETDECDPNGQKDHRTDQREQKSSFHHFFSIPLTLTH
jgi:hypothetical protein